MYRLVIPLLVLSIFLNSFSIPESGSATILPIALVGIGVLGMYDNNLKKMNYGIQDEFVEQHYPYTRIDDMLQYVPMVSAYGLNMSGIRGLHDFEDRTMLIVTSYALMVATVHGLKYAVKAERPDNSDFKSFPSGHTAMAFVGAEFVRQEYRDVSALYGITAYTLAAGTGIFRMYNNKHWFTDVCAGAGIGILCTRLTYSLYPHIVKIFRHNDNYQQKVTISPFSDSNYNGLSCSIKF